MASIYLLALALSSGAHAGFVNPGTPAGVPEASDCMARQLAYDFGCQLRPDLGELAAVHDALQLGACADEHGATRVSPTAPRDVWRPPTTGRAAAIAREADVVVYADAGRGVDDGDDETRGFDAARPVRSHERERARAGGEADGEADALPSKRAAIVLRGTLARRPPSFVEAPTAWSPNRAQILSRPRRLSSPLYKARETVD